MYKDEFERWLSHDLEDPDLLPELMKIRDNDDEKIWDGVGGTTAMPQTIVLNRHGEVIYNQRGSVTPEMLEELYKQAAGESPAQETAEVPAPAATVAATEAAAPTPAATEAATVTETPTPAATAVEEPKPTPAVPAKGSNFDGVTRLLEQYLRDRAETGTSQDTQ